MSEVERKIYGMVHLRPLPGTPFHEPGAFECLRDSAVSSARALARCGAHGCLVQTVDHVYDASDRSDPARIAALSLVVDAIVREVGQQFAVGVQVMRNATRASLAIAKVTGGHFVRATALVGSTFSDSGQIEGDPYTVASYRRSIDAGAISLIADIASRHHVPGEPVVELARRAARVGADGVAVSSPNEACVLGWIAAIRRRCPRLRVYLAGHTRHENAARLLRNAHGAFVGSCFERGGWGGPIDEARVRSYIDIVRALPPVDADGPGEAS